MYVWSTGDSGDVRMIWYDVRVNTERYRQLQKKLNIRFLISMIWPSIIRLNQRLGLYVRQRHVVILRLGRITKGQIFLAQQSLVCEIEMFVQKWHFKIRLILASLVQLITSTPPTPALSAFTQPKYFLFLSFFRIKRDSFLFFVKMLPL